jgi:uncharacterized membrane protein
MTETTLRSFVKTISWRITGSFATFLISYLIVGSLILSGTIAIIQIVANTILYYIHERIWNKVKWGRG